MPYDPALADRLRDLLAVEPDLGEKRMFGGLAFLVAGHLLMAASTHDLMMVRCAPERTDTLAAEPGVAAMVMRGRELRGWLQVQADGDTPDEVLQRWVAEALSFVRTLPPR